MEIADVRTVTYDPPEATEAFDGDWTAGMPVCNPMTRYPRYADDSRSWLPDFERFGCVVESSDGTLGFATGAHGRPVAALIDGYLGPRLVGEDPTATDELYDKLVRLCTPFGATGLASAAVSAIDLALWDLKGQLAGRPVYELLGGPARDEIDCYATGNHTDWYLEQGFEATKLSCPYGPAAGREGLAANEAHVARARELAGEDVELMLDCWMGLELDYAVRLAERLEPYGLAWIEEPLRPELLDDHASLRERVPGQPLATGEHWYTPAPFEYAANHGLVDVLQPDVQWAGGLTAIVRVASIVEAAGLELIPHLSANTPFGQHACYALPEIPRAEYFVATPPGVPLEAGPRLPGTPVPEEGSVVPADAPGFGIDVDPAGLEPFA